MGSVASVNAAASAATIAATDYLTPYTDVQYGYMDAELGIENFHVLIARGDYHRVSICLKKGLDPNGIVFDDDDKYERQDTPLMYAVRGEVLDRGTAKHIKTMDILYKFGANVNKYNVFEQTPLYLACERNLLVIVQWLITHGADVNKTSKAGVSPLLLAYQRGNPDIVKALLEHGARAIELPKQFSSLKFPTIQNALKEIVKDGATDQLEGENTSGVPPIKRLPSTLQRQTTATTVEGVKKTVTSGNIQLKRGLSTNTAIVNNNNEPALMSADKAREVNTAIANHNNESALKAAQKAREVIESYTLKQHDIRNQMLQKKEMERFLEAQRVYRDKLADENAKRKDACRLRKVKAKYEKYMATIEAKRMNQVNPLHGVTGYTDEDNNDSKPNSRPGTSQNARRPDTRASERAKTAPVSSLAGLQWTRAETAGPSSPCRLRSSTAPNLARGGRPTWVAQEIWATHEVTEQQVLHQHASDQLLDQCQQIYDQLQQTRDKNERLRMVCTAPDAEMLRQTRVNKSKRSLKIHSGQTLGDMDALPQLNPYNRPETAPI